jgi:hypothetical protein
LHPALIKDSKWTWDKTNKIEMNFQSDLKRIDHLNDQLDLTFGNFPFSSTLDVFQFVRTNGIISLQKVDDLSKVFREEKVDGTQAFVEFYSEDISKKDGNAKEIDSRILEKILQVIKSITIGIAKHFYATELYSDQKTIADCLYEANINPIEFNEKILNTKKLKWNCDIVGFAGICISSEFANFEDPATIARSARMIAAFPELLELIDLEKFYILHVPQNLHDIIMAHTRVSIPSNKTNLMTDFFTLLKKRNREGDLHSWRKKMKL